MKTTPEICDELEVVFPDEEFEVAGSQKDDTAIFIRNRRDDTCIYIGVDEYVSPEATLLQWKLNGFPNLSGAFRHWLVGRRKQI